jgi:hypothetical protein
MAGFDNVVAALNRHVGSNRGRLLDNPKLQVFGIFVLTGIISAAGLIWAIYL